MTSSNRPEWFQSFHSGENQIQIDRPHTNDLANTVYPLILNSVARLSSDFPYFLASYNDGKLFYYGFAPTRKILLELKNALYYSLGTSHTSHQRVITDHDYSFEENALKQYPDGIIRFELIETNNISTNIEYSKKVVGILAQIATRFELKPIFANETKRPIGRILRDFFIASREKENELVSQFLKEAKLSNGLSNRNIIGLELQAFAVQERWKDILNHVDLIDYLNGIIPSRIYHLLIRALVQVNRLDINDPTLIHFENLKINLDKFQPFLTNNVTLRSDKKYQQDWQAWVLMVLSLGASGIDNHIPNFIDPHWVDKAKTAISDANNELEIKSSFTGEFKRLLESELTIESATELFKYAKICSTKEVPAILNWLESLPIKVRQEIKACIPFRRLWGELEDHIYSGLEIPEPEFEHKEDSNLAESHEVENTPKPKHSLSWNDWFASIGTRTYNPDILLESKAEDFNIIQITQNIKECNSPEEIRNISPNLLTWIEDNNVVTNSEFWLALIELISVDDHTSYTTIILLKDLVEKLLETPHSKEDYAEALEAFNLVNENELSKRSLPTVIDFIELLFDYPIKDEDVLKYKVWPCTSSYLVKNWDNVEFELKTVVMWLEAQISPQTGLLAHLELNNEPQVEGSSINLVGKTVGISTLTETAGKRAVEILEGLFPGIVIKLNHDKVATDKLKHLAKTADYFIFCNKSAAHQSYYSVKDITKDIIYPAGKGSSSIVRALIGRVTEQ